MTPTIVPIQGANTIAFLPGGQLLAVDLGEGDVDELKLAHSFEEDADLQLWRNQLLGLSIEQDERQPYQHVTFSVVRHPRNIYLDQSLKDYQELIANSPKFSTFTSSDVIIAASLHPASTTPNSINGWHGIGNSIACL